MTNTLAVIGVLGSTIIPGVALYREWDKPDESTGEIKSPAKGDCDNKVKQSGITLEGEAKIVSGEQLWLITRPSEDKKDYVAGPVRLTSGHWKMKVQDIGGKGDKGKTFKLVLLVANAGASSRLRDFFERDKGMTPLSEGVRTLDDTCVTRTDIGRE